MAVTSTPANSALVVVYQTGLSPLGVPLTRQRSLNYLRFDADEEAVYNAAQALFSLSQYALLEVFCRKTFELVEE